MSYQLDRGLRPEFRRRAHRGVTALLAMLFIVLFSALGIGFYAAFTLGSQVSYNDREARRALTAAESGMEFIRFHLWDLNISQSSSLEDLLNQVEAGLAARLNGTANLNGKSIVRVKDTIYIPGSISEYITADDLGDQFRVEITQDGINLLVTTYGRTVSSASSAQRGVQLRYNITERPSSIFSFGVATRGSVEMDSNALVVGTPDPMYGSVLSTSMSSTPVKLGGNAAVSGDVSLVNPAGWVSLSSNATIAGSNNPAIVAEHIHVGVPEPEFPTIDTNMFKPFATTIITGSSPKFDNKNLKNIYIKANTNPTFDSNIKVEGVIYIETPNHVTFNSNVQVTGAIVVQNNPTGSPSTNSITFNSNVTLQGVDALPATADFPSELRALTGAMILAPTFLLHFNSNFGSFGGSIVGSQLVFDSNAYGTIKGSVINLENTSTSFDSNARISIASPGVSYAPAGMFFGSRYVPLPGSYQEVTPPQASTPAIEIEPDPLPATGMPLQTL